MSCTLEIRLAYSMWDCKSLAELIVIRRKNTRANTADVQMKPTASLTRVRAITGLELSPSLAAIALGRLYHRPPGLTPTRIALPPGNQGCSEAPCEANRHG